MVPNKKILNNQRLDLSTILCKTILGDPKLNKTCFSNIL